MGAARSDLHLLLFPFCGRRHWGDKGVDDWEAVGRDATRGLQSRQTSVRLHLAGRRVPKRRRTGLVLLGRAEVHPTTQPRLKQTTTVLSGPHSAAERLIVLIEGVGGSVRGAAPQRGRGAVAMDRLQAHRPVHLPWSCVGAGRARLQHTNRITHT